jgi:hypothetical protein
MMRRALCGFIIGSSVLATIWPLAGLGFESRLLPVGTLNWLLIGLFFPLLFGLTNALTVSLPGQQSWPRMLGIGAVMGFVSASVGTFTLNIPEVVYELHGNRRYLALLGGPIFYGLVWVFPVRWMNKLFALDSNPGK